VQFFALLHIDRRCTKSGWRADLVVSIGALAASFLPSIRSLARPPTAINIPPTHRAAITVWKDRPKTA